MLGSNKYTLVAGANQVVIQANPPQEGDTVVLRALDEDGNPIEPDNLVVSVGYEGASDNALDHGRLAARPDGSVIIPLVLPPLASDRAFVNVVSLAHDGARRVPLSKAKDGLLTVRFDGARGAIVTIRLTGRRPPSPRLGAVIVYRDKRPELIRTPFYETWFDGDEKRIVDVAPGEADIVIVTARGSTSSDLQVLARHPVTVTEGDNTFYVPVPTTSDLVLRVDALFVELFPVDLGHVRHRRATTLTKDGRATFTALPEGVWRVVPFARDDEPLGEAIVRTPSWNEVLFEPAERLEAYVAQVQPGGAAAVAGLQQDDVIVAVNGVELVSGFLWSQHLRIFALAADLTVEALREGRRIELSVPGSVFAGGTASGALISLRRPQ